MGRMMTLDNVQRIGIMLVIRCYQCRKDKQTGITHYYTEKDSDYMESGFRSLWDMLGDCGLH